MYFRYLKFVANFFFTLHEQHQEGKVKRTILLLNGTRTLYHEFPQCNRARVHCVDDLVFGGVVMGHYTVFYLGV